MPQVFLLKKSWAVVALVVAVIILSTAVVVVVMMVVVVYLKQNQLAVKQKYRLISSKAA